MKCKKGIQNSAREGPRVTFPQSNEFGTNSQFLKARAGELNALFVLHNLVLRRLVRG